MGNTFNVSLADILACPTQSLSATHYREDGTCHHVKAAHEPAVVVCSCGCGATKPDDRMCECGRRLGHH